MLNRFVDLRGETTEEAEEIWQARTKNVVGNQDKVPLKRDGMYRLPTFLFVYDTTRRALRILRIKFYRSFCDSHIVLVI